MTNDIEQEAREVAGSEIYPITSLHKAFKHNDISEVCYVAALEMGKRMQGEVDEITAQWLSTSASAEASNLRYLETISELQAENKQQAELIFIYKEALQSIANNTCCGDCQEAKRVAEQALANAQSNDWQEKE